MTAVATRDGVSAVPSSAPASRWRRVGGLWVLGFAALQLAWLLALPPYAGTDEVDHVYRTAGVASGQLVAPRTDAAYGTGALVTVPRDVVAAAGLQCRALPYTRAVNCQLPPGSTGSGPVPMPSSAGRYNPAYYAVVGPVGLWFSGYANLYALRLASMALCAGLLALAVWCVGCWARGPMPYVGLLAALTPMVAYSTVVVAPNGVEMSAAAALWCALIGLTSDKPGGRASRPRLGLVAVASAVVLATVRALGPLWLTLVVVAVLGLRGRPAGLGELRRWWTSRRGRAGCVAVAVAVAAGLVWTVRMHTLDISHDGPGGLGLMLRLRAALEPLPLWVMQSMGAFPSRGNPAPPLTYACLLALLGVLVVLAWRCAVRSERAVMVGIAVLGLLIPVAVTLATVSSYGGAWQGRYTLPFTLGLPLVAGHIVDGRLGPSIERLVGGGGALVVIAQVAGVTSLAGHEHMASPLRVSGAWWTLPIWEVAAIAALGSGAMALAASRAGTSRAHRFAR